MRGLNNGKIQTDRYDSGANKIRHLLTVPEGLLLTQKYASEDTQTVGTACVVFCQ